MLLEDRAAGYGFPNALVPVELRAGSIGSDRSLWLNQCFAYEIRTRRRYMGLRRVGGEVVARVSAA